jgi:WD40 repeat protein
VKYFVAVIHYLMDPVEGEWAAHRRKFNFHLEMSSASHNQSIEFFVTGGTMMPDAPSYLERQADRDLYDSLLAGKYCYVLMARQMGKSSLTARTAAKLREDGIAAVVVDLAAIGRNLTIEQWYGSVLSWIGRGIELSDGELEEFWQSRPLLSPVQKWMRALREIILPRYQGQLAVFVDEIDYVLDLPFPMDEFFAALRECYNLRAEDPEMHRLMFCLVGVAMPSDLIQNKRSTPFNIGRRIELHDFTAAEAEPLARGLGREERLNASLLKRVLYWTDGHPFLTQRLCRAIADQATIVDEGGVDRLCNDLFFTHQAQDLDDNLLFVRDSLLRGENDRTALLDLYAKVRNGKRIADDRTNALIDALHLSGVIRAEDNHLKVRNRIYERVFDQKWVERSMPGAELRRQRAAYRRGLLRAGLVGVLILSLIVTIAGIEIRRRQVAQETAQRLMMISYGSLIKQAQEAWEESNVGRVEELLSLYLPKEGEQDFRGFEWDYLWQSSHQEIQALKLEDEVVALRITPDGKRIAIGQILSGTENEKSRYRVSLFAMEHAGAVESFETQARGIFNKMAFSDDSRRVLVDSDENIARLFDTGSGELLATFKGHDHPLSAISISSDGQRVVTGDRSGSLLFGGLVKTPKEGQGQRITWIDLSQNGRLAASAAETSIVKIWDYSTGRRLRRLKAKAGVFTAATFFPNNSRLLTATKDGAMQVWDIRSGLMTARLTGHSGPITAIAFSPDGEKLATGGDDRTVKLWDLTAWQESVSIKGHGSSISAISWSSDGKRLATGSSDRYVKIWDVEKMLKGVVAIEGPRVESYWASALSGDGQTLAVAKTGYGKVKILRVPSGEELSTLDESANDLQFAVFSHDGERVATCGIGSSVRIWDVRSGERISSMNAKAGNVFTAAFSPDGKQLAFVYDDRTVRSWDTATGEQLFSFDAGAKLSFRLAFSPDGKGVVATCSNGDVILWDLETRQQTIFKGHDGAVRALAFSPDGLTLATGGVDNAVKLWDVMTGQKLKDIGQADRLSRMAFTPDGKRLITGSIEGTVKIWDALTWQELMILHKHAKYVTSITFSNDGRSLVTSGEDGSIKVWRLTEQ